jgi:2-methylisocitrate lyase-like PEP mutase family enzyme
MEAPPVAPCSGLSARTTKCLGCRFGESGGVAAALGYEDHERAPAAEMLAVAARISRSVDVPMTVDAEAGYGMEPADLVAALKSVGAAGCNLVFPIALWETEALATFIAQAAGQVTSLALN